MICRLLLSFGLCYHFSLAKIDRIKRLQKIRLIFIFIQMLFQILLWIEDFSKPIFSKLL